VSKILNTAQQFFEACDSGKGWDGCRAYCHPGATFSVQAKALADIEQLQAYTEWMKNLLTPIPDGDYEIKSISEDEGRQKVMVFGVFRGTQTGPGGPVEPSGKKIESDYVYTMEFQDGLIKHMTKIWNDSIALEQLGWA